MEKMTRRKALAAAGATAVAAAVGTTSVLGEENLKSNARRYHFMKIPPREIIQQHHFPNVELITQDGKKVHFYDDLVKNRKFVIQFMFTHCKEICPVITDRLVQVQKMLDGRVGRDIFFYSISLTPQSDTPAVLKAYAKAHGTGPGWLFLTGKENDITLLRRSLGYFYNNPREDANLNNHSGMVLIGDEPLMRYAHCEGEASPKWVASVIRNEANDPFIGSVAGVRQSDPTIHIENAPRAARAH